MSKAHEYFIYNITLKCYLKQIIRSRSLLWTADQPGAKVFDSEEEARTAMACMVTQCVLEVHRLSRL